MYGKELGMIKAIVFDYGNVLVEGPLEKWLQSNVKNEEKRKHIFATIAPQGDLGTVTFLEFLSLVGQQTNLPQEEVFKTIYQPTKVDTQLFEIIKKLKQNYTIAIFSNNQHEVVCEVLKQNNVLELFDEIVVSSKHAMIKPNKIFYKKLLEILKLQPQEVIFFDDKQENIDGAKKLGIKAFIYKNLEQFLKDLQEANVTI